MRYFYAAVAFLVAGGISVFFDYGSMAPYLVAQTCVLGATVTLFLGTLHLNDARRNGDKKP